MYAVCKWEEKQTALDVCNVMEEEDGNIEPKSQSNDEKTFEPLEARITKEWKEEWKKKIAKDIQWKNKKRNQNQFTQNKQPTQYILCTPLDAVVS